MPFILLVSITGGFSFNVAQNFYSGSWSGGETGSFVWMFMVDLAWERRLPGSLLLKNGLKCGYGQTHYQSTETGGYLPPIKSTDRIEDEHILKWVKGWAVDPFTSLTFQSQFYDNRVSDRATYINPIIITISAGASRTVLKGERLEVVSRIGYALKENLDRLAENSMDGGLDTGGGLTLTLKISSP